MKKTKNWEKYAGIFLVVMFLATTVTVNAATPDHVVKVKEINEEFEGDVSGDVGPLICPTVAYGIYYFDGRIRLYGVHCWNIPMPRLSDEHYCYSIMNVTLYFSDGVVIEAEPMITSFSWQNIWLPQRRGWKLWTDVRWQPYSLSKLELHVDKWVDGEYYEYSKTFYDYPLISASLQSVSASTNIK